MKKDKLYQKGTCTKYVLAKKVWKIMRLTGLFVLVSMMVVSAGTYSQNTRFSFKMEEKSLYDFFLYIENNSEFKFAYNKADLDDEERVSFVCQDETIEQILKKVLDAEKLTYKVIGSYIIITDKVKGDKSSEKAVETQQNKTITGVVKDTNDLPLPGVTVVVKGTINGVVSDVNGWYSLDGVTEGAILVFSFVGMVPQEIAVAGQTTINVTMQLDAIGIEEVIAIGYGTVKKKDLSGAISTVEGESIAKRKSLQLSKALQGALPGVMVTRTDNSPGSEAQIRIRGITTIGDSDPLIIVDGVPVNSIDEVNSNDIENISVLKDAASASIYGSRAAAGVILITTKRAKTGTLSLDYNMEYGFNKPTEFPEYNDAIYYMEIENEASWNDVNNTGPEDPIYPQSYIDSYLANHATNPDLYPNTDWRDMMLRERVPRQSHLLSLTAGTNVIRTKISFAYDKIESLFDTDQVDDYQRITARINTDINLNSLISSSVDFFYRKVADETRPNYGSMIYKANISAPIFPAVWSDGRIAPGKSGANYYGILNHGGFDHRHTNDIGGKLALNITPVDGLKISGIVAPSFNFYKRKDWQTKVPYTNLETPDVIAGYLESYSSTNLEEYRNDSYQVTTQFLANYLKSMGEHDLNAMFGYESFYAFTELLEAGRDNYEFSSFEYLDLGNENFVKNGGRAYENAYQSYFGRAMYDYKDKYLLQANGRYDGSSRFHEDSRWAFFPSVSAAWVITEESFMDNLETLSFLKLRLSYGTLGNERIGNYPYQSTIAYGSNLFYVGSAASSSLTAYQDKYAVQDISWETTESYNIGLNAVLFDNHLRLSAEVYEKTTKDMLLVTEIPLTLGLGKPEVNAGDMSTKGWEFEVNWNDQIGEFNYSASFNISDFKTEMGDLAKNYIVDDYMKRDGALKTEEGGEYREFYGYLSDGLFQTQEEIDNSPTLTAVKPGDIKYKDISGPDGVPDGQIDPTYDKVLLGGSLPRYMYGGNLNCEYKSFDLLFVFQGVGKLNAYMTPEMVQPIYEGWGNTPAFIDGNYWSVYNTEEQNLNAKYPRLSNTQRNNDISDYWMFNGAYFRLKNIALGYTIPEKISQKINIKKARLYASVSDVFSIDNYPKGWDPEVKRLNSYPVSKTFLFGLSVKF